MIFCFTLPTWTPFPLLSLGVGMLQSSCGRGDDWDTVIYPGMKQALINVLQVTQDEIEHRKVSGIHWNH